MNNKVENSVFVAIWMVTYNHEDFIAQAIEGVMMQQTKFSYKLFIGEDCSTDKTREICLAYKEKFPDKIELILQEKNVGANTNAQTVYKVCFGSGAKYIAMCEGDDYWTDPNKLQIQVDFLENNPEYVATSHANMAIYDDSMINLNPGQAVKYKGNKDTFTIDDVISNNIPCQTSTLVFRNVFKYNYPQWTAQCLLGDWALQICLGQIGYFKYFKKEMGCYRVHAGGSYHNISVHDWYKRVSIPTFKVFEENITSPILIKKLHARRLKETLALNRIENNRWAYSKTLFLLMWQTKYSGLSFRDLFYLFRNFESYSQYLVQEVD